MKSTIYTHEIPARKAVTIRKCYRCMLHVTKEGNPDPYFYSPAWLEEFYSKPEELRCKHQSEEK